METTHLKVQKHPNPDLQLTIALSQFLSRHTGDHRLYLIYYAGHGYWDNEMKFAGSVYDLDRMTRLTENSKLTMESLERQVETQVVWNRVEHCLVGQEADILLIFDCCYAGALLKQNRGRQTFEFLGACDEEEKTPKPGKKSFTSAMIWALEGLAKKGIGFDSKGLRQEILHHESFRDPKPPRRIVLEPRFGKPLGRHIYLEPLSSTATNIATQEREYSPPKAESMPMFLDFRLLLSRPPGDEDVKHLASCFTEMVSQNRQEHGLLDVQLTGWSAGSRTEAHFTMHDAVRQLLEKENVNLSKNAMPAFLADGIERRDTATIATQTSPVDDRTYHLNAPKPETQIASVTDGLKVQDTTMSQVDSSLTPKSLLSDRFSGDEGDLQQAEPPRKRKRSESQEVPKLTKESPRSIRPA